MSDLGYTANQTTGTGAYGGISGSVLKWVAIITMFLDHIGASLIEVYLMDSYGLSPYKGFFQLPTEQIKFWIRLDLILRCIGRIAFPIFCFLLVEGFLHTRNVKKYAFRMGLFCLISEIPFDLAFHAQLFYWEYQNVFFTLLLGLLGIWGLDHFKEKRIIGFLCALAAALAADFLKTDYGAFGVFFVEILYLFRNKKIWQTIAGILCLLAYGGIEVLGSIAFLPIWFYSGARGRQPKYFFYVFYPAHLLLIVAAGRWILPFIQ